MLKVSPAQEAVTDEWFDPGFWGSRAIPVSTGGRGGAWFIQTGRGEMVLRHYLRGGLMAKMFERTYFFTGEQRIRCFEEFHLLTVLFEAGLPVPEPVAAWAERHFVFWYRAAILINRIEGAQPMPNASNLKEPAMWYSVGETIRRFHDAGLDHVDLNCDNILVAPSGIYLIDLDRCRLRNGGSSWKKRNLKRLKRSVDGRMSVLTENQRISLWQSLLVGYHQRPF